MSAPRHGPPRTSGWLTRHLLVAGVALLLLVGWYLNVSEQDPRESGASAASTASAEPTPEDGPEPGGGPDPEADDGRNQSPANETTPDTEPAGNQDGTAVNPVGRGHRTYLVTRVVDGDTVELGNGEHVRIVGIDTPERGECGYDEATAMMERLVLDRRVRLTRSGEDRDRYGRLLRYVDVGRRDVGLEQIEAGLAVARYDSRDGYGYHPRENRYIAADEATPQRCAEPKPAPQAGQTGAGCAQGYSPCVPPFPPDVDCADVDGPVRVTGPDPHGLDRDGDGVACES